jgi:hypothetical protein
MRGIHLALGTFVLATACGGPKPFNFDDGGVDSGTIDDSGNPVGDTGCPFCGVDSSSDGTTPACTPNPANFDVPGNNCDDDGDGVVDNIIGLCDTGLPTASPTATQFGKAIGICPNKGDTWGVTTATYTQGVGSPKVPLPQQYGTNATFGTGGVKARQGSVLGILSSGVAAAQDCGTGEFKGNVCTTTGAGVAPPGYPKPSIINKTNCPVSSVANDVVDVVLKIQVPANAKGFSFDFNFYSGEWPEYVCTTFNDSFVAWLTSTAWKGNSGDFNISFDPNKNPVNVNNSFFEVCAPANLKCSNMPAASTCKLTSAQLAGTGFGTPVSDYCGTNQQDSPGGATGWLTTQAPVTPGETITLQFMVWNTGDEAFDSSVLIDNWQWIATDTGVSTGRPPN